MKKVLVLGAQGMLGNAIYRYLNSQAGITVIGTARTKTGRLIPFPIGKNYQKTLAKILHQYHPHYVINCIGLIRPADTALNDALLINAIFPQILAQLCTMVKSRLIHFSTNGVFSGKKGNYKDIDIPDATDIYGISKYLGEIRQLPHLTIRTSLIGNDLNNKNLLSWFISAQNSVNGYSNVYWNGVTTLTMAKIIHRIINRNLRFKKPLIHIVGNKTSKYALLNILKKVYNKNITIMKNKGTFLNQTLLPSIEQKLFFDIILPVEKQVIHLKQFYAENHLDCS